MELSSNASSCTPNTWADAAAGFVAIVKGTLITAEA
jgi:hypothetical protein